MIPDLDLPVLADADVVVAGGGPAGVAAALAAARSGADVLLLEQTGACGGMSTSGLVPVFIHMSDREHLVASGICHELVTEMCRRMGIAECNYIWQHIDPEILKRVYDDKLAEAGVRLFLSVKIADVIRRDDRVAALAVATSRGLKKVTGRIFIDATGDGLAAAAAGVPFELGDAEGRTMSPSLCVQYSNIDLDRMREADRRGEGAHQLWFRHKDQIPLDEYHIVGVSEYGSGSGSGNLGHVYGADATDEADLTRAYREGRRVAEIIHRFYRRFVPGYEKADLTATAPLLGVRESRRIRGDYRLNFDDYRARRHFPDEVGCFYYPVDIHASTPDIEEQKKVAARMRETAYSPGENYGIPYRSLIAQGVENLLVAGRCISVDREVQSSLRVMPGCMITGTAAGAAAALAVPFGRTRRVDPGILRDTLRALGAYLPEVHQESPLPEDAMQSLPV